MTHLSERFWSNVAKGAGCWNWTGRCWRGYGQISFGGRKLRAHRVAWELANGPIPAGLCVCHTCDNPGCVRPDHLFLGTQKENVQDMVRKGRGPAGRASRSTHCNHGHEYTPENTITKRKRGRLTRSCRACTRAYNLWWDRNVRRSKPFIETWRKRRCIACGRYMGRLPSALHNDNVHLDCAAPSPAARVVPPSAGVDP